MAMGNTLKDQGFYKDMHTYDSSLYYGGTTYTYDDSFGKVSKNVNLTFTIGGQNYTEQVYLSRDKEAAKKQVEELFLRMANNAFKELNR